MNPLFERKLYSDPVPVTSLMLALEEKESDYHDETIAIEKLFMDSTTGNMVIKNGAYNYEEYLLQDQALQLLLTKLKVPCEYAKRCPHDLLASNVNHWLSRYPKSLFIRFDRNEIRSILTQRYNPVSNLEMVRLLYNNIKDQDIGVRYEITPSRFIAQFISLEKVTGTEVGDPCQYGIHLCNSETGHASAGIKGLILRLICSNGLVSPFTHNSWSRTHRSQTDLILDEMESSILSITSELPEILRIFYSTREILFSEPAKVIKGVSAHFKLTDAQQEEVQKHVTGNNLYSLVNAFTHAGSHKNDLSMVAREQLQEVGGKLITFDRYRLQNLAA